MNEIFREIAGLSAEKRELLRRILQAQGIDLGQAVIVPAGREKNRFPLSFSQQRLWFLEQLEPGSPLYTIPCALRLKGTVDVDLLHRSLEELVRRHEVLRTTFEEEAGQPVQVIQASMVVPLDVEDLRSLPPENRSGEAVRRALKLSSEPFDLRTGPLLRARLWRIEEAEYFLFLPIHHIVSDGWSTGVLLHEIKTIYAALLRGEQPKLPEMSIQYADYAVWQRGHLTGELLESHLGYWRKQLEGSSGVLELISDFPRPAVQTYAGSLRTFEWSREISEGIAALARHENSTVFMVLVAILETLLYRLARQSDISIGTPIANRNRTETESLLGFFINTLVLRVDLSGDPTFRELLGRVRETTLGALAHQDLPFETLVEAVKPERSLSLTPLFQVMFVLNNAPLESLDLPGLKLEPVELDTGTAKFDLVFSMIEGKEGLRGKLEFNTDLYRPATIERMLELLGECAESVVKNPDLRIRDIPTIKQDVLAIPGQEGSPIPGQLDKESPAGGTGASGTPGNGTIAGAGSTAMSAMKQGAPRGVAQVFKPIHLLIEEQAARTPDAPAVIFGDLQITYDQLNRRANRLARELRSMGVKPDVCVGMFLERSAEMYVTLLAILKAGGAYVPLDPGYPADRISFMLQDARIPVVLTVWNLKEKLRPYAGSVLLLDRVRPDGHGDTERNLPCPVLSENLAYVIYTSGSTGLPKGVLLTHGPLSVHCVDVARYFAIKQGENVMQFSSLNFDASLEQILTALICGATLVIRGPEVWTAEEFRDVVERHEFSEVNLPTAYWHQLLLQWKILPDLIPKRRVRLFIVGGDQIVPEALRLWHGSPLKDARLVNAYGPTETVITATGYDVPPDAEEDRARVPIGSALSRRTLHVLDERGMPVPPGIPGELYVGGECLARGYLNRPDLTAQYFLPDPFSPKPGSRMYRSGDLVREREGRIFEFLGRADQQVKVRGFRVELGEIESVVIGHPFVREAAVVVREEIPGDKRIVAYVVFREGTRDGVIQLRDFLKSRLPDHFVPSAFVEMSALPINAVGKVDRRALPAPELDRSAVRAEYVAPRTLVEGTIAEIVAETLGLEKVGVRDNFFDIGGHSMLATQVISRVKREFAVEIPLRSIFESPTVEGLSLAIAKSQADQLDPAELQRMLDELDNLTNEDAERMLGESAAGSPGGSKGTS